MSQTRRQLHAAVLAFPLLAAGPAAAQLFKCTGADGKVVYSDQRCDTKSTDSKLKSITNAPKDTASPLPLPAESPSAGRSTPAGEAPAQAASPARAASPDATRPVRPERLSYGQEERIRNLETTAKTASRPEQRTAARMEIDAIRSGREAQLSSSDRSRRDSLVTDLDSIDHRTRQQAQTELRRLYEN